MQSDNLIFSAQYQQDQICSKICMKEKNSSETLLLAAQCNSAFVKYQLCILRVVRRMKRRMHLLLQNWNPTLIATDWIWIGIEKISIANPRD